MLWPGLNARPPAVGVSCCPLNGLLACQILVLFHHEQALAAHQAEPACQQEWTAACRRSTCRGYGVPA